MERRRKSANGDKGRNDVSRGKETREKRRKAAVWGELLERVKQSKDFRVLERALSGGRTRGACPEVLLPLLLSVLYTQRPAPYLVLVPRYRWAEELSSDLRVFLGERVEMLPPLDTIEGDPFKAFAEGAGRRHKAAGLIRGGGLVVAVPESLAQGMPAPLLPPWPLKLERGASVYLEELVELLTHGGYAREYQVDGWGQFAVRGGIVDIFPSTEDHPVRIEMVGDEVESLREFNVVTQRSTREIDSTLLFPAECPVGDGYSVPGAGLIVVERELVEARWDRFFGETGDREPPLLFEGWTPTVEISASGDTLAGKREWRFEGEAPPGKRGRPFDTIRRWSGLEDEGIKVLLMLDNAAQIDRLEELWKEEGLKGTMPLAAAGRFNRGFYSPQLNLALYTSTDLFGRREGRRREERSTSGTPLTNYAELKKGEYVVHVEQGIGIYGGLVTQERDDITREYLLLNYASGDKLYVPTVQLSKVQRYVGAENPRVNRLRSREWSRIKQRAKLSAARTARGLLELYLERKTTKGFVFSSDTAWQRELEDSFEYEDTPDQSLAAEEVKRDMESDIPMDRLVCGDVGYGKTEIAVRAAMKAVMDSKQVAVLVPTTVLAQQHLETFRPRLAPFPVNLERAKGSPARIGRGQRRLGNRDPSAAPRGREFQRPGALDHRRGT